MASRRWIRIIRRNYRRGQRAGRRLRRGLGRVRRTSRHYGRRRRGCLWPL